MPTATPFKALGKGNGFPTCLNKVNVSSYDNVQAMTLQEAMKIYWNLASITYFASSSGSVLSVNISGTSTATKSPIERVCNTVSFPSDSDSDSSEGDSGFDAIHADVIFNADVTGVRRLYNGSVTNEGNFIGYGINSLCTIFADYIDLLNSTQDTEEVSIHSYVNDSPESTITTISIGGVTFLKETYEIGNGDATVNTNIFSFNFYTY